MCLRPGAIDAHPQTVCYLAVSVAGHVADFADESVSVQCYLRITRPTWSAEQVLAIGPYRFRAPANSTPVPAGPPMALELGSDREQIRAESPDRALGSCGVFSDMLKQRSRRKCRYVGSPEPINETRCVISLAHAARPISRSSATVNSDSSLCSAAHRSARSSSAAVSAASSVSGVLGSILGDWGCVIGCSLAP